MGFNISGIAINKKYENNIDQLQSDFGWNLKEKSEIDFETASANWTDEGVCNVYFSKSGTLIFLNMEMCVDAYSVNDANCLTFALSETSMAFNLNYCEGKKLRRSIMEVSDKKLENVGEKLSTEESSEDTSELIINQISQIIGEKFYSIEPDEKALKFILVKEQKKATPQNIEKNPSAVYNDIATLINTRVVSNGLDSLEKLKDLYTEFRELGGQLNSVELLAFQNGSKRTEKDIKDSIYKVSKDWERQSKIEDDEMMAKGWIMETAAMWSAKKIDISDLRNGTFVYKKWWQFWK